MLLRTTALALLTTISLAQAQTTQESQEFSTLFYAGDYQDALSFYKKHSQEITVDAALINHGTQALASLEKFSQTSGTKKALMHTSTVGKYVASYMGHGALLFTAFCTAMALSVRTSQDIEDIDVWKNSTTLAIAGGQITPLFYAGAIVAKMAEDYAGKPVIRQGKFLALKELLALIEKPIAA